ncbi:hypothetical protein H8356DRAFT_1665678 [Neocallimastix lanati (nom. inval.)]|uniref:Uncharacterized protein n=1 Tax=Neocallimastix californiae TaxID=1754190 RepID=A0A1Y2FB75_9FUNG|nr:hypothetical protein H8356DRAFT_1665678 [Neocallimastix sp. JGI-2020a]ORY81160.1 hypothetical protein LY90DRAFT_664378 [Neocallimastix californiae]|eukprot:ORY81160.1 hypothetical protein LY90DRAFT_664378 [Neocallimastix californiae]
MSDNAQKEKNNVNENENISNKKRKREALREHFEQLKKKKLEIDKKLEKKEQLRIKKKEKKKKEKQKKLILKYETAKKDEEIQSQINNIIPYIEPNKQLKDVDQGRFAEKSPMELKIEKVIKEGNFELAEKLNEELILQQKEKMLNDAIDCKNFVENKNLEKERKKKKRKRLVWGFDSKQRWETKGNM